MKKEKADFMKLIIISKLPEKESFKIRSRFGHFSIQRGLMLADPQLSSLDPKADHIIYPEGFLK